ncbi:flagellar hook-basal body complex protein FliE [Paenibacillus mendelii]|uniref:Flagellar hook-basal body complex protein FliE n=1 Tax=Paenibacillus mendelii TaxID=206163 RepID=A0ABV6JGW1_9BACL|nr:flagellar hook-basal body complex protein FliE [Paenibacillus mendelii]MCQ6557923.1 flagellar hook-basal body complex protein FliE [Paenibacillus mendelii]
MIQQTTINPVQALRSIELGKPADKTPAELTQSFGDYLNKALNSVDAQEKNVHALTDQFFLGQVDVTKVMIASEQAQLSLQLTSQIRNKVIDAYHEIMRMQL